jgi:hypothetical protein
MYTSERNPNTYVYGLLNETIVTKLSPTDIQKWLTKDKYSERKSSSFVIQQCGYSIATYTFTTKETLQPNDISSYISLPYAYDENLVMDVHRNSGIKRRNIWITPIIIPELFVVPGEFKINTKTENRDFTVYLVFSRICTLVLLWNIYCSMTSVQSHMELADQQAIKLWQTKTLIPFVNHISNQTLRNKILKRTGFPNATCPSIGEVHQLEENIQEAGQPLKLHGSDNEVLGHDHKAIQKKKKGKRRNASSSSRFKRKKRSSG